MGGMSGAAGGVLERLRLLVVDQDLDSRVATRKAVQRIGLDVAGETGFGTAGVSRALELRPDIILVAVEEPVVRPLETVAALSNALPNTPIIIYSSISDAEAVRRAMIAGSRDYLVKPLQAGPLREALLRTLENEERRQMRLAGQVSASHGRGTVVVITGAKGGIGKSVLAVNLALSLRQKSNRPVVVLDADDQFGDIATMLDLAPASTFEDLARKAEGFNRDTVQSYVTPHASGIDVIAGSPTEDVFERMDPAGLKRVVDTLAQVYEFVVVDTSGTFNRYVRACIEASTLTLVVTTNEVSSVRDAAAAFRRIEGWEIEPEKVRVVLNRGIRAGGIRPADVREAIGRDIFWELPFDKRVPESVQVGRPVTTAGRKTPLATSIADLAARIGGTSEANHGEPARKTRRIRLPLPFVGGRVRPASPAEVPESE